jgi:BirA family biotin operon repressor/biotin-[acetyl-CoA-carboxylase] ligase
MIPLIIKEETASTNDDLWQAWAAGRREPLAVLAMRQTRGRGRRGRRWSSCAGNLHLSALFLLDGRCRDILPFIPLGTALAAVRVLASHTRETVGVKWPNDLMLGDRKCGGILAESRSTSGAAVIPVVVGIGLNLNAKPGDFPEALRGIAGVPAPPPGGGFPLVDIGRDILYHVAEWLGHLQTHPACQGERGRRR